MSSKEFMFYICWTFSSFIIFPLLQYNFSRDVYEATYKEIIPEMVYGIGKMTNKNKGEKGSIQDVFVFLIHA